MWFGLQKFQLYLRCLMKKQNFHLIALIATLAMVMLSALPSLPAWAGGIAVNIIADSTLNDGKCSLREAIINANDNATTSPDCASGNGADTITFSVSGTIRLMSALPYITDQSGLTIDGSGQSVTISGDTNGTGNPTVPIFMVDSFTSLTLQNLTLIQGNSGANCGGAASVTYQGTLTVINVTFSGNQSICGGAVANDRGTVSLTNSTFTSNISTGSAGAIANGGTMTITNSTFSGNSTTGNQHGGAIINGDSLTITNCTFFGNHTDGYGWGGSIMNNGGTLVINSSTFSGNTTKTYGGAIAINFGPVTAVNSTFYNNSTDGFGGAIWVNDEGSLTVTNGTLSGNVASAGNSIYNNNGSAIYPVTLRNTILVSSSPSNCGGLIVNDGNNIDSDTSCGWGSSLGSLSNTNPLLAPLANNGGATQTMAPLPVSPAIDGVIYNAPNGCPSTDQRGFPRVGLCDIGAYEYGARTYLPLILR
jgi:CSLREA domain-containing protein